MATSSSSPLILKATGKDYHVKQDPVPFDRPVIGPKIYLARGPSGWHERFCRKEADVRLGEFLDPLDVDDVAQSFIISVRLAREAETWGDVVAYLAKITDKTPREIPEIVCVALWARAILLASN